jgi:probable HAF family extracellular repeat protein
MRLLGVLPGTDVSGGEAITASGKVIGSSFSSTSLTAAFAYIWDRRDGMRPIDALLTPGGRSGANDINRRGQIVGSSSIASGATHAYLREPDGEVLDLDPLGSQNSSFANALNDVGQVVGILNPPGRISQGFIWDRDRGMQPLLSAGLDVLVNPVDINNRGQIAVFLDEPVARAARWTPTEGLREIGSLGGPGDFAQPSDINEWGVIVGSSLTSQAAGHAFLWTEATGMIDLNERVDRSLAATQNMVLGAATAINEFGWIAAVGIDVHEIALGRTIVHAYVLIPQISAGIPGCR